MSEENPGVDLYRDALYIIDSGTNAARMRDVLAKMANLGRKLVDKSAIGLPMERRLPATRTITRPGGRTDGGETAHRHAGGES